MSVDAQPRRGGDRSRGGDRWRTPRRPSPRPAVTSVRVSLEPRPCYRCWTGRQEAASSCGLFSRAGFGEPGKETGSGAGSRMWEWLPFAASVTVPPGTARLACSVWLTMTGGMPRPILQLEKLRPKDVQKLVLGLAVARSRARSPKSRVPSNP